MLGFPHIIVIGTGLLACEPGSVSLGACEPVSLGFLLGLKKFGPITVD
jgi:hypothetical protein